MEQLNYRFFLSLCIVLAGYGFKRAGMVTDKDGEALSRVVLNITLPALILDTFSSFTVDRSLVLLPIVCVATAWAWRPAPFDRRVRYRAATGSSCRACLKSFSGNRSRACSSG